MTATARKLKESQIRLTDQMCTSYDARVEVGTTVEEILRSDFYMHIAKKLRPQDILRLHWQDMTKFVEVYVIDSGPNWTKVKLLREVSLDKEIEEVRNLRENAVESNGLYEVQWGSPSVKWRVIRKEDRAVVKEGFATKEEGNAWVTNHIKALKQ